MKRAGVGGCSEGWTKGFCALIRSFLRPQKETAVYWPGCSWHHLMKTYTTCLSVGPPLWSTLKYLHFMFDCHEIMYRHPPDVPRWRILLTLVTPWLKRHRQVKIQVLDCDQIPAKLISVPSVTASEASAGACACCAVCELFFSAAGSWLIGAEGHQGTGGSWSCLQVI